MQSGEHVHALCDAAGGSMPAETAQRLSNCTADKLISNNKGAFAVSCKGGGILAWGNPACKLCNQDRVQSFAAGQRAGGRGGNLSGFLCVDEGMHAWGMLEYGCNQASMCMH